MRKFIIGLFFFAICCVTSIILHSEEVYNFVHYSGVYYIPDDTIIRSKTGACLLPNTNGYRGDIVIPDSARGKDGTMYPIVDLSWTFNYNCDSVTSLTLPNSLRELNCHTDINKKIKLTNSKFPSDSIYVFSMHSTMVDTVMLPPACFCISMHGNIEYAWPDSFPPHRNYCYPFYLTGVSHNIKTLRLPKSKFLLKVGAYCDCKYDRVAVPDIDSCAVFEGWLNEDGITKTYVSDVKEVVCYSPIPPYMIRRLRRDLHPDYYSYRDSYFDHETGEIKPTPDLPKYNNRQRLPSLKEFVELSGHQYGCEYCENINFNIPSFQLDKYVPGWFRDYTGKVLVVPMGCAEAYRNDEIWGKFKKIREVPDIDAYLSTDLADIDNISNDFTSDTPLAISYEKGAIVVTSSSHNPISVFSTTGVLIYSAQRIGDIRIPLSKGNYIISQGQHRHKIFVR